MKKDNLYFQMDWARAAKEAEPKPHTTHYLHPTKGWKKGDGKRMIDGGKRVPKGFKLSDGTVTMLPRKTRRKINKLLRTGRNRLKVKGKSNVNR